MTTTTSRLMRQALAALGLGLAAGLALTALPARADATGAAIADYQLFVDPPMRFAYIKLPQRQPNGTYWKFVGQLDERSMDLLPAGAVTSLRRDQAQTAATSQPSAATPLDRAEPRS
ncbi:hypothetical protein [Caldimonas sp. KR1-144]|uniref:hypothetical protein n=1 Tax=Caldimonas sp. KR1-144 TaxID=3400911 RepID=UPI003C00C0A6